MAEKKVKSIDPNKSQIKGSRAKVPRRLNLSTSLLHSREMRKEFGCFAEHTPRRQKPEWLTMGLLKVSCEQGIFS